MRLVCTCCVMIALVGGSGCAALDPYPRADGPDAGGIALADAGASSDAAPVARDDASAGLDGGGISPGAESDARFGSYGCFNGRDDDRAGSFDCRDEGCRYTAPCCVGSTEDACCDAASAPVAPLAIGDCTGPITTCDAIASRSAVFGPSVPTIVAGGIAPIGSANSDSGIFLTDGTVDPRAARVELRATLAGPHDGCGEGCVDGAIVALTASAPGEPIEPLVAMMVSGSRRAAMLLVGDDIVATHELPDSAAHEYVLTVRPTGEVVLERGSEWSERTTVRLPDVPLRAVLYGRSFNPAGREPARLTALEVRSYGCDVPAALTRRGVVLPHDPSVLSAAGARQPHVALRPDGEVRMAVVIDGAIFIATRTPDGSFALPAGQTPALVPAMIAPGGRLADPFLVPAGDATSGRWLLLYAAIDVEGRGTLMRARGPEGWGEQSFDPHVVGTTSLDVLLSPTMLGEDTNVTDLADVASIDGPSAIPDGTEGGAGWIVVARVRTYAGSTRLVLLRSADSADGAFAADPDVCTSLDECETPAGAVTRLATLHEARAGSMEAFDRDEVAAPAIVRTADGLYRVYYAGRRGTRWSIGMLHSVDLRYFASAMEPVLRGTGTGWDMLGVTDPAPFVEPAASILRLYHGGTDGAHARIGVADQSH